MAQDVNVRWVEGNAEVRTGETRFAVSAGEEQGRSNTCPVELILAALGS
ncbi:MAG: hypothetical protein JRJ85_20765 [Deltaproteobacteria bacterium]|nr:hypothetical protein [Deltaproteobacteria bacterium]